MRGESQGERELHLGKREEDHSESMHPTVKKAGSKEEREGRQASRACLGEVQGSVSG